MNELEQIGTWHAAQWKFLARRRASKVMTLDGLDFLPRLIVQGNDWFFVASTRKGDETTLWTEQPIGSTWPALGTCQVIRAVQYLAWWCEGVYWPWFKENIFDFELQDT
ncbi:Putative PD-(D/E)XK nuclease [Colletotrichum destructivum]|uniref:PD-(D/E)XK nuclease n=1 Tax=Colletotrichum destructivum TaxID=34406 RepID=A0AAX4I0T3_9PEZI|nr:Putative PD-(D/E)XK nuclease [Colletotrichum destructivum]